MTKFDGCLIQVQLTVFVLTVTLWGLDVRAVLERLDRRLDACVEREGP